MIKVPNDPSWWPIIDSYRVYSYFAVAACTAIMYDWALTLGPEIELIWSHHWSLMTAIYFIVRYAGIPFVVMDMLISLPSVPVTDAGCNIMNAITNWMDGAIAALLGIVVITRLNCMYQRSRKMLIFLIIIFLVINIACVVMLATGFEHIVGELILYGIYECSYNYERGVQRLIIMVWVLNTVWEVLALCLSIWIAIKHFREPQLLPTGSTNTVLIKTHVAYFAIFVVASCLHIGLLSPKISRSWSTGAEAYYGLLHIFSVGSKFVLGPRLLLGVREFHANHTVHTGMASIAPQEPVRVSTSGGV